MQKKLSFKSVFSLVIGSQIGSGIFLLPASLAVLGPISLFGWCISGAGAIFLALIFAQLSMIVSKGGGPHVYLERAFGRKVAFFTAWTYWVVSWVSSLAVIIAAVGYLSPILGIRNPLMILFLEILITTGITWVNIRGAVLAGSMEIFLTLMKCIPLILIPIIGLFYLRSEHFFPMNPHDLNITACLSSASLMTFWGFVGLETATTTAGIIENPTKIIPRAVILGTLTVVAIYFINSFGMMGIVPNEILVKSQAPYVDATQMIFGNGWNFMIGVMAFIACLGTLNAWVLTSGQIAVEAAKDNLFPACFAKSNSCGAPYVSLLIALFCTLFLLVFSLTPDILAQLNYIIDVSVTTFLFIYLACMLAFMRIVFREKLKVSKFYFSIAICAAIFCVWVLSYTSLMNLFLCFLFMVTGVPIYIWQRRKVKRVPMDASSSLF